MNIGNFEAKLVDDWKKFWTWALVRVNAVIAAAPQVYMQLRDVSSNTEVKWLLHAVTFAGILAIVARISSVGKKDPNSTIPPAPVAKP